ncbi:phosphatase PAP2 family protein [Bacteroidota bacterium]
MVDFLYSIDVAIFYFINHTISNPLFDKFFPFITEINHWYLVYFILWCIAFFKGGRTGKVAAVLVLILIAASDQLNSTLLKNLFGRIRPCNALPDVNILAGCTGSYSFPSSHAVNNFAVAVFFYRLFPKFKWILLGSASLIALSRPYVGVHYPSDILFGALLGVLIGYIFSIFAMKIELYLNEKYPLQNEQVRIESE